MGRAGVVQYPVDWKYGGYHEIQNPKQRYSLVNRQKLADLLGIKDRDQLSGYHRNWVEEILKTGSNGMPITRKV
jgi:putative transposase